MKKGLPNYDAQCNEHAYKRPQHNETFQSRFSPPKISIAFTILVYLGPLFQLNLSSDSLVDIVFQTCSSQHRPDRLTIVK
jgi:hypothetical protein